MNTPELHWLPIEPTPLEREWIQKYETFQQELLAAYALSSELLGSTESNALKSGVAQLYLCHERFLADVLARRKRGNRDNILGRTQQAPTNLPAGRL